MQIYIHIPFCKSRCSYCDFCSSVIDEEMVKLYIDHLLREIDMYFENFNAQKIDSIFIGGGTPSVISAEYIAEILKRFKISDTEITIEANPGTLDEYKLSIYRDIGINRISLGVQSFNEKILRTIGRIHSVKDVLKSVEMIRKIGFKNLNLDLMSALPYQNLEDIKKSIEYIKILNPEHISYYSLIIEDVPIKSLLNAKPEIFPDEITDRDMYHYLIKSLSELSYEQYEISNFSKSGYRCIHNIGYWRLKDYLGFGMGAHSNIGYERWANESDFKKYFNALDSGKRPLDFAETLNKNDRINEYVMLGLRLNDGIDFKDFKDRFGIDFRTFFREEISIAKKRKLICSSEKNISSTKLGRDLSNRLELLFFK